MYRWIGGFRLHLGIALIILSYQVSFCQGAKSKLEVESSTGVLRFDKNFAFDSSPFFGLGAGYNLTHYHQLNLSFKYTPAQQRISQAAADQKAEYAVFNYDLNLRLYHPNLHVGRFKPFVNLGAGGMVINPKPLTLELGGGERIKIEPPINHKYTFNFGIGLFIRIFQKLKINFEARNYLFKLNDSNQNEVNGNNKTVGLGFVWKF